MSPIDQGTARDDGVASLARETGFGPDAIDAMRRSIARGGGRMAQFDHPAFGGAGQWMQGGLLMISDPSDLDLKRRIDRLCDALSRIDADPPERASANASIGTVPTMPATHQWQSQSSGAVRDDRGRGERLAQPTWYPASLGTPDTSGSQNDLRYAWFAAQRRLAVDRHGVVTLYDTGDHRIGGVSQQQGAGQTLSFASQHGDVELDRLPVVGDDAAAQAAGRDAAASTIKHDAASTAERDAAASTVKHDAASTAARDAAASTVGDDAAATAGRDAAASTVGDDAAIPVPRAAGPSSGSTAVDPFVALEKLADLHARGIVDDAEFTGKKRELLARI